MNTAHAFHALRELALAGATTTADEITAYRSLAALAQRAGLPEEAALSEVIAAGLDGAETMELKFRELGGARD